MALKTFVIRTLGYVLSQENNGEDAVVLPSRDSVQLGDSTEMGLKYEPEFGNSCNREINCIQRALGRKKWVTHGSLVKCYLNQAQ